MAYTHRAAWVAAFAPCFFALCLFAPLPSMAQKMAQKSDSVSYADILADPDNPRLNEKFARQRLAQGDAKAALAAVERVLVAQPANLGARFFRAEVLAALGADLQAIGELRALGALPLPDAQRKRVGKLLAQIKKRQKRLSSQASLSLGVFTNDNASGWPDDGNILYNGAPLPDTSPYTQDRINSGEPISEATKDTALTQMLAVSTRYDTGHQNWRHAHASLAYQSKNRGETGYLDGDTLSFGAGMAYQNGNLSLQPRLSAAHVRNDFADRLGTYDVQSASLTLGYRLNATQRLIASLSGTRLLYDGAKKINDTSIPAAQIGLEQRWGRAIVSASVLQQDTDSDENNDLDKRMEGLSVSLRMVVRSGHFFNARMAYLESTHDNVYSQSFDPREGESEADGQIRADETVSYGVTYTVLGQSLHPRLDGFSLHAGAQLNETDSNLTGFSTSRNIATLEARYQLAF